MFIAESEAQLQLECAQTEVEFLRRRLRQTEERLESEKDARQQLDVKVKLINTALFFLYAMFQCICCEI